MTAKEIRSLCIDASQVYYDYLERNGKGIHTINILSIAKVKHDKLKLKVSSKIFDEESLVFKSLSDGKEWTIESIKIQVYDRDTNNLIIKPNAEVYESMAGARASDWIILSDLKFLVERVEQWYEVNGKDLALPKKASSLHPPKADFFFEDDRPSEEQRRALDLVFKNPLSYIWGAPGTGKTQFVLSYAILNYLADKKKVAIVAPTNHALEQIYRGVIKMTDKAGIERKQILRLGGPSKKFADEYPDVCEVIGLENQLRQLDKQIDILENILGIDEFSEEEAYLQEALEHIAKAKKLASDRDDLEEADRSLYKQLEEIEINVRASELRIRNLQGEQESLRKKRDSLLYGLAKVFGKNKNYTREIERLIWEEATLGMELKKADVVKEETLKKIKENNAHLEEDFATLETTLDSLGSTLAKTKIPQEDIPYDFGEQLDLIKERLDQIEDDRPVYETLATEYRNLDETVIRLNYEKLKEERARLANYSTEERLRNVSIIGATLDTYLYRFREEKLKVNHIFLDEAGYSNIIKALTLFNQKVPITFLGDHMQLPPVCELSKQDIQQNEEFRPVTVWDRSAIYIEDVFEQKDLTGVVERYLSGARPSFRRLKKENLTGTFRFGRALADVLQQFVYPEGFSSQKREETEVIIYDVQNPTHLRNGTRKNQSEVTAIGNLIRSNFTAEDSVAILAPYTAQVRAIGKELPDFLRNNKVLTVHKSQGQEWDTVVFSVCDIGNGKRPWFTDSQNPLSNGLNNINTAISRTKKTLIIVCDAHAWKRRENQLIAGVLEAATQRVDFQNLSTK